MSMFTMAILTQLPTPEIQQLTLDFDYKDFTARIEQTNKPGRGYNVSIARIEDEEKHADCFFHIGYIDTLDASLECVISWVNYAPFVCYRGSWLRVLWIDTDLQWYGEIIGKDREYEMITHPTSDRDCWKQLYAKAEKLDDQDPPSGWLDTFTN